MKGESGDRRFLKSLIIALLLLFALVSGAAAQPAPPPAIQPFILPDQLPADDDGSSSVAVDIGFPINFFGRMHEQLFVNNNGNVTFDEPLSEFTPFGLVDTQQAIIAPFFADVDTRGAGSGIVRFGTPPGRPGLFVVDWINVGYYNQHDDKLNSFQLILEDLSVLSDPGDVLITFNYGQIQWETGDASGGTDGRGGSSARVGFSNGSGRPGTFFELAGSGENGAFLDGRGGRGLIGNRIPNDPSLPLGRYQFLVQDGEISEADLAIAVEIFREADDTGFDISVFNFGPLDAEQVGIHFTVPGGLDVEILPRRFCTTLLVEDIVFCVFPIIADGGSRRIRVMVRGEPVSGIARIIGSSVLDSDLSNNVARAPSCKGRIWSQSEPTSVEYEPTATEPARRRLRLGIINTADDQSVEIRRIRFRDLYTDGEVGTPLQISRIRPPLPVTIGPGGDQLFRVDTIVPAGMPARTAQRPYFTFQVRCPD